MACCLSPASNAGNASPSQRRSALLDSVARLAPPGVPRNVRSSARASSSGCSGGVTPAPSSSVARRTGARGSDSGRANTSATLAPPSTRPSRACVRISQEGSLSARTDIR